jgi:hypothetical protein
MPNPNPNYGKLLAGLNQSANVVGDGLGGGIAVAGAGFASNNSVIFQIGETALDEIGITLPALDTATGYSAPKVIYATIRPQNLYSYGASVSSSYNFTSILQTLIDNACAAAYTSTSYTINVQITLSDYDSLDGYTGIAKMLTIELQSPFSMEA